MSNTRRSFLQSTATLATGLTGVAPSAPAQESGQRGAVVPAVDTDVQIPKVEFGKVEISRLILGVNPFYGFAHFNNTYSTMMREWYSPARVIEVLQRCEKCGINAFNYASRNVHSRLAPKFQNITMPMAVALES